MDIPKVTVIVPVYNAESTLVRCLDSLVEQTYESKEILLVNDGSKDGSQKICEQYSQLWGYITLINQENAGPATARNTGIDLAKGKYIYFVDADDYVEKDILECMVSAAEAHDAEMVICGYYQESNGKKLEHKFKYDSGLYEGPDSRSIAIELINDVSETRIPPYSWVRMVRRDVFENPRIRYPDGIIRSEDYYFYVQVHFRIKRLYLLVDEPLYHYMEVSNSVTHSYIKEYWGGGVKEIYFGLKKYLPKQPNIVKCIDLMLVQRSLIALNNSARVRNKKIFKHEIYQILKDDTLRRVANQISFGEGVRLFGAYYILLRLRMYKCIYFRYFFKYIRSV